MIELLFGVIVIEVTVLLWIVFHTIYFFFRLIFEILKESLETRRLSRLTWKQREDIIMKSLEEKWKKDLIELGRMNLKPGFYRYHGEGYRI